MKFAQYCDYLAKAKKEGTAPHRDIAEEIIKILEGTESEDLPWKDKQLLNIYPEL
jgi:hypothetical protein